MRVVVEGLWHLGCVTAAALASMGHEVVGFDRDEATVDALCKGVAPVFEPGLAALIAEGLAASRLSFVSNEAQLPANVDVLWVAYDTPVDEHDVADVAWVRAQVRRTLPALGANTTVLISSQLPVGSTRSLAGDAAVLRPGDHPTFAASPENLRLGKALDVFLKPDRVIVGIDHPRDRGRIASLLAPITDRIEWMSIESAEMTKHAINAFLATSVVFANEIATICEVVGADAKEVERGLKSEQRIGPSAYVSPGGAFAGGTLARDIEYLKAIGTDHELTVPLLGAVRTSNDQHKTWVRRRLATIFPRLAGKVVVVWGLRYKVDTDTLRRSLSVELCEWLLEMGATVRVHDARVAALPSAWSGRVERFDDARASLVGADVLLIGTESPEYRAIEGIAEAAPGLTVLDANRFLRPLQSEPSIRYIAVGTPTTI